MKISVITVTYNSAATVQHALSCVAEQDYANLEHIIVDGASTDDTLNLVRQFPHVYKVISEKDDGIYDAMNKGIQAAGGEVIGILNSDDLYVDGNVISAVAKAFENPEVDTCYADLQYVDRDDVNKVVRTWKSGDFSRNAFYWGWMPPHPTFFVRRKVYEQVGLFNTRLKSAADYEMMLRILVKHGMKTSYIPRVIVRMRSGGLSNASLANRLRANREDRLAWKINGLQPYFFTLYVKPLRKLTQFITR